ncbi:MAG: anti-sigma factor [Thermoanaerobaculia bacterium]
MTCETMQERLTARLHGELSPTDRAELEAHLAGCPACAAEAIRLAEIWSALARPAAEVPSARMRQRLEQLLESETPTAAPLAFGARTGVSAGAPGNQEIGWSGRERRWLSLAAMLLVGLGLGYFAFGRRDADVASLQREVGDLHEMVALSLLERSSVSERLQGVSYGRELSTGESSGRVSPGAANPKDDRIITALFARLIEDPSVNVRLAALEALRPIADRDDRRGQLVAAVTRQDSPLVALSLIDLLLESGTAAARHDLEQLLANDQLDPVVRGYLRDRLGRSA